MDEFVLRLVDELPAQYKVLLTLYHVDSMSYPEICEVTAMPEGTVKNYLFRARNLLKEKVKKYLGTGIFLIVIALIVAIVSLVLNPRPGFSAICLITKDW